MPLDEGTLRQLGRKNFSEETIKKVRWVRRMFAEWRDTRNDVPNLDFISCDLEDLVSISVENFVFGMCRFITEIRKIDGTEFPAKTLYQIVVCIQFHLETLGIHWKLLEDPLFIQVKFTLDNMMKKRTSEGIGITVKKADVITTTDEDILWSMGLLGNENPQQLLNTVIYVIGISCALRAGKEHRSLRRMPFKSQFSFLYDENGVSYIQYQEDIGLKTNKGGIKHRKIEAKCVDIYPFENSDRCPVRLIEQYMSLLPDSSSSHAFYLQPLANYTHECWYRDRAVGVNKLQSCVKDLCKRAGFRGNYSNHSLRATAATRLYHNNCDEQLIQEVTGHRSLVVRSYKRTCQSQRRLASECLFDREPLAKRFKIF